MWTWTALEAAGGADFHHPSPAPTFNRTEAPTSPFEPYENTSWLDIGFVAAFQVGWWAGGHLRFPHPHPRPRPHPRPHPRPRPRPHTLILTLTLTLTLTAQATVGEVCAHACAYATLSAQLAQAPPRKRRSFDWDRDAETRGIEACVGWGEYGRGRVVRGPRHAC